MNRTVTTEEMIRYVTLRERSPEAIRFVARMNGMIAKDETLRRQVAALEALYDEINLAPTEERRAFLQEAEALSARLQQR